MPEVLVIAPPGISRKSAKHILPACALAVAAIVAGDNPNEPWAAALSFIPAVLGM